MTLVRDPGGEAWHLSRWAGLGKRSPKLAGLFAFFLLAFAGIPLTSGFFGKYAVFRSAAGPGPGLADRPGRARGRGLGGGGVLLRPGHRADVLQRPLGRRSHRRHPVVGHVDVVGFVGIRYGSLGVFPQPVLDLAEKAAKTLFVQ